MSDRVAVYFVASPLQYLAARRIAEVHEADARQVLVWYKPGVTPIVREADWDAAVYMPWPRWEPLPGPFGRLRRQRANIRLVAGLVGRCSALHIHSAVFDTEAINYFLRALPKAAGATQMHARILPDGLISIRRYPLSLPKRLAQYARKLRRLIAPELDYWCFSGDRIGSDAPFCDRVYVLPGLPHEYPADKAVALPPLVTPRGDAVASGGPRRALVIGQPLVGAGLMKPADRDAVSDEIHAWLAAEGMAQVFYKGHPKDPERELNHPDYSVVTLAEPLEVHLANTPYDAVVGVRSSALLFARQTSPASTRVVAFGWDRVRFKSADEKRQMSDAFRTTGVCLHDAS
ncbi:polysialyltransferase family glycosyltransferase [Zoogloea sp.]|uniref:polysialyltransferase family glycosyltransferase n=1 Tax=Zoogloea sp. TaxID=49181 RepID=UPI0025E596D4|nr:polysialyltransferase family glycosyltransferase [Zoogloea sp.]MCK6393551.1 alpha-2,8-polysialyltransferase family protein [Zoogloea sp.]